MTQKILRASSIQKLCTLFNLVSVASVTAPPFEETRRSQADGRHKLLGKHGGLAHLRKPQMSPPPQETRPHKATSSVAASSKDSPFSGKINRLGEEF